MQNRTRVRYHGSLTAQHGDQWTLLGECWCDTCDAAHNAHLARPDRGDLWPPIRYALLDPTTRGLLLCVRGESFTLLTERTAA